MYGTTLADRPQRHRTHLNSANLTEDTGTVVASNRDYAVVAQPPAYVAARIRVLEKQLVVDHASFLCPKILR